jgi:hypothetical protein
MAKKAASNKPFKPGDRCNRKAAPHCPGRILRADPDAVDTNGNRKKGVWVVEFDLATRSGEKSIEQGISSRMLKRGSVEEEEVDCAPANSAHLQVDCPRVRPRRAAASAPSLVDTDVSSSHHEVDQPSLVEERHNEDSDEASDDEDDEEVIELPASTTNRRNDLIEGSFTLDTDEEEDEQPLPTIPTPPPNTTADEYEEEDIPLHGEIPVEPESIHKAKWAQYKSDKAHLLSEGWVVTKTSGASNEGIAVGATVHTRGAERNRREGAVVGQNEVDGKKVWLVDFGEGADPEPLRPLQLVLVHRSEEKQCVWTLVEDSEPLHESASTEYADGIGLAGFNFPESFKPPPSTGEASCDWPYLKLLQSMWPGDWKQQLRQLNLRVAAENATNSNKKNWRNMHPISQQEWWVFVGILISAGPHGKGGNKLWERSASHDGFCGMTQPINYGPNGLDIMAEY